MPVSRPPFPDVTPSEAKDKKILLVPSVGSLVLGDIENRKGKGKKKKSFLPALHLREIETQRKSSRTCWGVGDRMHNNIESMQN